MGDAAANPVARPMSLAWNSPMVTKASATMVEIDAFEMDDEQARRSRLLLRDEWSCL
jgi:hypothetical protein